jgi:hypothetical protein
MSDCNIKNTDTQQQELSPLEIFLETRINGIKFYLAANERDEDEEGFPPSEELKICYLAKRMLALEKAGQMPSIEVLNKVKDRLTPDEYDSIAYDLMLLAKIRDVISSEDGEPDTRLDQDIEVLGLSTMPLNCLKRNNINTLRDLSKCRKYRLIRFRGLGSKSLKEIIIKSKEFGIEIK